MNFDTIFKKTITLVKKHSTVITACLATSGVVATTIMAIRETPKVNLIFNEKTEEKGEELNLKEKVFIYIKGYWRTIALAVATILLVTGGCVLKDKEYATLAGAYMVAEKKFSEYKETVKETVGEKKAEEVRQKVIEKELSSNPQTDTNVFCGTEGKTLFFDKWSGRYFWSDIETIRRAANECERSLIQDGWVSLDEFYYRISDKLPESEAGSSLGWSGFYEKEIGLIFDSKLKEETMQPVIVIGFINPPTVNYDR